MSIQTASRVMLVTFIIAAAVNTAAFIVKGDANRLSIAGLFVMAIFLLKATDAWREAAIVWRQVAENWQQLYEQERNRHP